MNDSSNKRNRAGNFVQEDTDLFLSLVKENRKLIESGEYLKKTVTRFGFPKTKKNFLMLSL